jgi:hypothetical protein
VARKVPITIEKHVKRRIASEELRRQRAYDEVEWGKRFKVLAKRLRSR